MAGITIERLDHVHVHVTDRAVAAAWFSRVLGLRVAERFSGWARDLRGPLFLVDSNGNHCLALFQGGTDTNHIGDHTIAFKVGAAEFIRLVSKLDDLQLSGTDGSVLSRNDVVDHLWPGLFTSAIPIETDLN